MNRIRYIQPYACNKNIGRAYNEECALVPPGDWICITDQDVMYLRPDTKEQIQIIVNNMKVCYEYSMLSCMTNRLGLMHQCYGGVCSNNGLIQDHMVTADLLHSKHYGEVEPINHVVGGFLMLFPQSTWEKYKFKEQSMSFDTDICQRILMNGGKIGIMKGVYVFHLYRFGQPNPKEYNQHLRP